MIDKDILMFEVSFSEHSAKHKRSNYNDNLKFVNLTDLNLISLL